MPLCRKILLALIAGVLVYRVFFDPGLPPVYPARQILQYVHDGDTVTVAGFGRCRIRGIDTPELWEFHGGEWREREHLTAADFAASDYLKNFLQQEVRVQTYGQDRYGRWLIDLILPNGVDAAAHIRAQGWEK